MKCDKVIYIKGNFHHMPYGPRISERRIKGIIWGFCFFFSLFIYNNIRIYCVHYTHALARPLKQLWDVRRPSAFFFFQIYNIILQYIFKNIFTHTHRHNTQTYTFTERTKWYNRFFCFLASCFFLFQYCLRSDAENKVEGDAI